MRYDYVILIMILIVCMATLCILLKILKKISLDDSFVAINYIWIVFDKWLFEW